MSRKGPAPKPTALKQLQGNPGRRPVNDREPKVDVSLPEAPSHLDAGAVREWNRIAPILEKMGCLSEGDRGALAGMCSTWSLYVNAMESFKNGGPFDRNPDGKILIHPAFYTAQKLIKQYFTMASEFGLTPSSRTRIKVETREQPPAERYAFDGGKK